MEQAPSCLESAPSGTVYGTERPVSKGTERLETCTEWHSVWHREAWEVHRVAQ